LLGEGSKGTKEYLNYRSLNEKLFHLIGTELKVVWRDGRMVDGGVMRVSKKSKGYKYYGKTKTRAQTKSNDSFLALSAWFINWGLKKSHIV
jgi:hypothetical protein